MLHSESWNVTAYAFGRFRLDTARRLLLSETEVKALPEKLFQILLLLLQANGRVVDKETLFSRVWPDESVSDGNLAQHIFLLRKILDDETADNPQIVTVPRQGYRLAEPGVAIRRSNADVLSENAARLGSILLRERFASFDDYCKACHFLEKRTATDLQHALALFQASLDRDAGYVQAWLGLARTYALLGEYAYVAPSQAFPLAREAVTRALSEDRRSETAHAVLSEIVMFGDWNFQEAETSIKLALDLNPQSLFVRHNLAWYHICSGNFDEAVAEAQRGLLLDPASMVFLLILGRALLFRGDVAQAISCCSNVLETQPGDVWARMMRGIAFLTIGEPRKAIDDLQCVTRNGPEVPLLARAFVDAGDKAAAERMCRDLAALSKTQYVSHWDLAVAAAALAQTDAAIEQLSLALHAREPLMLLLPGLTSIFGPTRNDARFQQILQSIPGTRSEVQQDPPAPARGSRTMST
jgi:DNA-binding winged helix-turn-helix (wHTH) protein/Flp pilus assembly protein TadD